MMPLQNHSARNTDWSWRLRHISLKSDYELIIIGGGIQGCALFWEAQSRGLKSLLVEKHDFCSQTSANSLKTIHGGIRYLQSLNLARTWRSSKEPEILARIAPHLVHELACLLPTEQSLNRSRPLVAAGFSFYNLIKKFSSPSRRLPAARCLSKAQLKEMIPMLDHPSVTGAGMWFDAQVQHAERLGLAFVKSAQSVNGDAYNYMNASILPGEQGGPVKVMLEDGIDNQAYQATADSIIFCTASATVKNLDQLDGFDRTRMPRFCLAVNLVINKKYADYAIGLQSGFAARSQSANRRLLFAAPWRQLTLFGTWYFHCPDTDRGSQVPSADQIRYCLEDVNSSYPGLDLQLTDIARVHGGLLPLSGNPAEPENNLMEHDLIVQPDKARNIFSIIPTKFTTCRLTASKMIDLLVDKTSARVQPSVSARKILAGGDTGPDFSAFVSKCGMRYQHLVSRPVIEQLCVSYGDQMHQVMRLCETHRNLAELIPGSTTHVKAQLQFELDQGSVFNPGDFIHRRSFLGSEPQLDQESIKYCCETINRHHGLNSDIGKQVAEMLSFTLY